MFLSSSRSITCFKVILYTKKGDNMTPRNSKSYVNGVDEQQTKVTVSTLNVIMYFVYSCNERVNMSE